LITFPLGFAIYLLFFWQFFAHLPFFNFYHQDYITFGDKITHFLAALVITLVAVKWNPKISTVVFVFLILTVYELFEIVWIVNVAGAYQSEWQEILPFVDVFVEDLQAILTAFISIEDIRELLILELVDVVPDMIFNTLGVFAGYIFTRKLIAKAEKKEKRKQRK
jgi:VanZ family protein